MNPPPRRAARSYNAGCSVCGGAALYDIPANTKPTAKGLATAAGCYSCYAKAGKDLQVGWLQFVCVFVYVRVCACVCVCGFLEGGSE